MYQEVEIKLYDSILSVFPALLNTFCIHDNISYSQAQATAS